MLGGGGARLGGLAEEALDISIVVEGGKMGLVAVVTALTGGGGIVPTTGDDIMGGTIGNTEAEASFSLCSTSLGDGGLCFTASGGGGIGGPSIGILCKYP